MRNIQLSIIGQKIQLFRRQAAELNGLNMGEKLSFDFYNGVYHGVNMLFVKPKGDNPTPRKCAIISERMSQLFNLPVVFILAPGMTYERKRLMDKGVYFIMSDKYACLPTLVVMEKIANKKIPLKLSPVAQYLLLYHLQVDSLEGKSTRAIASLMPYSYESVSIGLTCLSDIGLCEKILLDSRSKTIRFKSTRKALWEEAQKYLINPVDRRIYCDDLCADNNYHVCGINALAHYTSLNPDSERWVMMTAKEYREANTYASMVNPNEFDGNIIVEIWKYPSVCSKDNSGEFVDKLSLALSLKGDEDPRVEEEVEQMINRMQW